MYRIIFTGAQGTGKTTVLKELESNGIKTITEVVRNLNTKGVKINKDGDEKGQNKIFKTYKDLLGEFTPEGYVSDRGLLDVMAYTKYLVDHGKVPATCLAKQEKQFVKFRAENPDIAYCYFPIEFDIVADEVRDPDKEFQAEIDNNIKELMAKFGIVPITIKGTVEERVTKVKRVMRWILEGISLHL